MSPLQPGVAGWWGRRWERGGDGQGGAGTAGWVRKWKARGQLGSRRPGTTQRAAGVTSGAPHSSLPLEACVEGLGDG